MATLPRRASLVVITSLCVIGCTTSEERRQKLLDRRAALVYQPEYMTTPDPPDWSRRPILNSREFAVADIDRELAELDREEAEKSFGNKLAEDILIGFGNAVGEALWAGLTGDDH